MRIFLAAAALLAAAPAALAGQATGTLGVSVTVLAACPAHSGRPCAPPAPTPAAVATPAAAAAAPIAVLRDEMAGTVTIVY